MSSDAVLRAPSLRSLFQRDLDISAERGSQLEGGEEEGERLRMILHVRKVFLTDGPNWGRDGQARFSIAEGSRLYDVSERDRFGYRSFTYEGQRMKKLDSVLSANAEVTDRAKQDWSDIESIRKTTNMVHAVDSDAVAMFHEGRIIFDVGPHGIELDRFIERNRLQNVLGSRTFAEGMLPGNRRVYMANKAK